MDATIAALVGAAIGGFSPLVVTHLQQRAQDKRERMKMAVDLALADQARRIELATRAGGAVAIPPIAAYVMTQFEMLEAMANGSLTPEEIAEITARNLARFPKPEAGQR